ncbi:MAG: DUF4058 family protein [Rhodopirellula sp.]|nr:DUF4058 family protein [Rhodopirellula sp.]
MPIHDWGRVIAGVFHDFHGSWITHLKEALNGGVLPEGFYALSEQQAGRIQPDVLTLRGEDFSREEPGCAGGIAVAEAAPRVDLTLRLDESRSYALKQRTIAIRHRSGDDVVALIEIVSPANKDRERSVREFVDKAYQSVSAGVHLLVVDLFPPGKYDSHGMHGAIWSDFAGGVPYDVPRNKPLTLASYEAGDEPCAYVQPTAVGTPLVAMPLFLQSGRYVNVPLETTYQTAFAGMPERWKAEIDSASGFRA